MRKLFETLLELLMKLNILAPKQCDQATSAFNSFIENLTKEFIRKRDALGSLLF